MASIIKCDTIQSTTANVFVLNSSGTEYARFDATGVFQLVNPTTFPAGTAALPAITTTGDTNTGIYFPAADTIAFSKGGAEAMRIDSSANLQFNSGYGSVATAYGCRAWVNFNGTGTVAIRASANVSSITDNATGDYTVNFTTAMPDGNYAAVATAHNPNVASAIANFVGTTRGVGSAKLVTYNDVGGVQDCSIIDAAFFR